MDFGLVFWILDAINQLPEQKYFVKVDQSIEVLLYLSVTLFTNELVTITWICGGVPGFGLVRIR
jgi:hypothetical protein